MPFELTRISATQLEALSRTQTVFFFPVGPIEDHGPHLPMGLDFLEAAELCRLTAGRLETDMPGWTGVVMPAAPLGLETNTTKVAITVRPHVLRDWLVDGVRSLQRMGFRHFVCYSGHLGPKQLTAIEDAGKTIARLGRLRFGSKAVLVSASSKLVAPKEILRSAFWPDPLEHGGLEDTSVALAACGDQVHSTFRELPEQPRGSTFFSRAVARFSHRLSGYWGAPAQASEAQGVRFLNGRVDDIFPKLRAVWEGASANQLFRSWYSIFPPNKSFFRSWILIFMVMGLLVAWMTLTLRGLGR